MPLKHATETALVFLLGVILLITGVVLRLLPALPGGMLWWGAAFALSLVYPLLLYPLLRKRRAEYSLRALHFLPAMLLLLWLLSTLGAEWLRPVSAFGWLLRWGLGLLPVALGMLLLMLYCLSVIRQRATRVPLLLMLFVPFSLLALATEWNGWAGDGRLQASAQRSSRSTQANLEPSEHATENNWRGMLRRMERREERLMRNQDPFAASSVIATAQSSSAQLLIGAKTSSSRGSAGSTASLSSSSRGMIAAATSSKTTVDAPPALSSTGLGLDALGVLLGAGYFTALQRRAMRRRLEA